MHTHNRLSLNAVALALGTLCALSTLGSSAHAANATLSGNIVFHNDVVQINFTLASAAADVRIWSDSWRSGLNFDPTGAVWSLGASGYSLVRAVDDDDTVSPTTQGYYDFGFVLPALAAGQYRLTLATAVNAANGSLLSQGFTYDSETPIPIGLWNQPSYNPNTNDQKGSFWQVHFSGVDSVSAVPEPAGWLLATLGALAVVGAAARRNSRDSVGTAGPKAGRTAALSG